MIGWLLLAGFLFIILYELFINKRRNEAVQVLVALISSIAFFTCIIVILLCRADSMNAVINYESTVNTYLDVKDELSDLEKATYINKLVDVSKDISKYRYWNNLFDPFFVDSVDEVKPLKEFLQNDTKTSK